MIPCFISEFIEKQLEKWSLAATNFNNLKFIERKHFKIGSLEGFVQLNPARAVSNLAKVDSQSIKERKCFLCEKNRPADQLSLEIIPGWKILINPFPILNHHLTIVGNEHLDQEFIPEVAIVLSKRLPGMTVFYNAEGAGASAPDHRHYQAVESKDLPIVKLIEQSFNSSSIKNNLPFYIETGEFKEGDDPSQIRISKKFEGYPINAFFWVTPQASVRYILIPRKAHRPECFFAEPPSRRSISPGAIDMAGILITPFREDFELISENDIQGIYSQVGFREWLI